MEKPIIGVTPLWDGEKNSYWMLPGYLEGVQEAGAIPVILPLAADGADAARLADLCDGLLFTGGQDVSPQLYGEERRPACGELCPARDALERELLNRALEQDKPILGICRGLQFLNAALGGTLYQDLPTEHPSGTGHSMKPPYDRAAHAVHIWPMTPLASAVEKAELAVYGGVSGIGYRLLRCRERPRRTYTALGTAMVAGRLVNGDEADYIVRPQTYEDLLRNNEVPSWIK